jgi:hypothetical protein
MTKDEILSMASKSGFGKYAYEAANMFERFAALVAKNEREGCILELERNADKTLEDIVAAIRARENT